jgi:hypothetical protein
VGACWLGSFAALFWARSTRRETFKKCVAALIDRENLQPHQSERDSILRDKVKLESEATRLSGELARLTKEFEVALAEGEPLGSVGPLHQVLGRVETLGREITALIENNGKDTDAKRDKDRRFQWELAAGGLVAGFLVAILSHQIGLT